MRRLKRISGMIGLATLLGVAHPWHVSAESRPVGVVASLEGPATVARASTPQPAPLRFKDDVFVRDRITTGERAIVRILLRGKATVTAREHSMLVITEGAGTSVVHLTSGAIAVAVAKDRMKPGEVVEIRTPNAITAIRGTIVVAEVAKGPAGYQSTLTVLRGVVDVTRLDSQGQSVGGAVDVGALERVTVAGSVSPVQRITRDDARRISSRFSVVPSQAPARSMEPLVRAVVENSTRDVERAIADGALAVEGASGRGGASATPAGIGALGASSVSAASGGTTAAAAGVTAGALGVVGTASGLLNGLTAK